jgi:hypothetical protein
MLINQERKLGDRRRSDTVVVLTINYADSGSARVDFIKRPCGHRVGNHSVFGLRGEYGRKAET